MYFEQSGREGAGEGLKGYWSWDVGCGDGGWKGLLEPREWGCSKGGLVYGEESYCLSVY